MSELPDIEGKILQKIVNFATIFISLCSFFIILALGLNYKNIYDIKEEIKSKSSEMQNDFTQKTNGMSLDVSQIRLYSKDAIEKSVDFSKTQIEYINQMSISQAKISASLKVQELFNDNKKINEMVENEAQKLLTNKLDSIAKKSILESESKILDYTNAKTTIDYLYSSAYSGEIEGFRGLDSIINSTNNKLIKEKCTEYRNSSLEQILSGININDWKIYRDDLLLSTKSEYKIVGYYNHYLMIDNNPIFWKNSSSKNIAEKLINCIRNDTVLNNVIYSYFWLEDILKIKFNYFDKNDFEKKIKNINLNKL